MAKRAATPASKPIGKPKLQPPSKALRAPQARRPSPLPEAVEAQLATLGKEAPEGDEWLHELKFDGYRILARVENGVVTLASRRGNEWTDRFPAVRDAVAALPARAALLDGEIAIVGPDGRTSFQALQNAFDVPRPKGLQYFVFDLLHLDGEDLRGQPLEARKERLAALLPRGARSLLRFSDHVVGQGDAFFRSACARGLEGIISKRRDAPYVAGRSPLWLKTKCTSRQEMVVGGFTEPEGSRVGIGALHVGHFDGEALRYAGKVGTGFTQSSALALRARLDPLVQAASPFVDPPTGALGARARWVKPALVAEIEFGEWTDDGRLRHPVFKGLREDKAPADVRRERPGAAAGARESDQASEPIAAGEATSASETEAPAKRSGAAAKQREKAAVAPSNERPKGGAAAVAGQRLSHPERVLWPAVGAAPALTKRDLARYFEEVGDAMLPYVVGRPLSLVRCPEGIAGGCFFAKHANVWAPPAVRKVQIQERHKVGQYLVVESVASLLSFAQLSVLELHTWNALADEVERPTRVVLDLDPGPEVPFAEVIAAAQLLRQGLAALRLESFVKTTGGKGLHVVVPIVGAATHDDALAFARAFAETIARERPSAYTTAMPKQGRERKILIDFMRNSRGQTSVAELSPRARPAAPVATPLAWDELGPGLAPSSFTTSTVPQRLRTLGADPWDGYARVRQRLPSVRS